MIEDVRYAARSVVRAKGLTAALVLSLALGTGANAAVFGIVYRLLLSAPDGVADADSLVSIYTSEFSGALYGRSSYPDLLAIRDSASLEAVAAIDDSTIANVRIASPPDDPAQGGITQTGRVVAVTADFFSTLRMHAHAGRLLDAADDTTEPRGAVISYAFAEVLDGAGTIVGRTIEVGPDRYLVVGVSPRKFRGLQAGRTSDVWVPMPGTGSNSRGDRRLSLLGRRRVPLEAVQRQVQALGAELAAGYPDTNRGAVTDPEAPRQLTAIEYSQLEPEARSETAIVAGVVLGAVGLLLASACVNAGSLLLSRAMARRRELAVKMALGAGRAMLVRQLLYESLIVSLAAGVVGLLLAAWLTSAIPALFTPEQADLIDTSIDPMLVLLTVGIAAIAGALFGIAPAIHGTGASAVLALRADAGGVSEQHGGSRMRAALITAQLALSTVLLIATGLLITGLSHALKGDFGVKAGSIAMLSMENPGGDCRSHDPVRGVRFHHAMAATLPKAPGVLAAGWASTPPLGRNNVRRYAIQAGAKALDRVDLNVVVVTPGYFTTLGIPLVEGRLVDATDGALAEPVAVIDELLARRYFGASAAGQHLLTSDGARVRIAGVVRSGRYRTLQGSAEPTVYLPYAQEHMPCGYLFVRTASEPATSIPAITGTLTRIDGGVTIRRATSIEQHLSEALLIDRLATTLVGLCGIIALVMGTAGVYGVMSDAVLRRTREIGLRMALGAGRRQVVRLVVTEAIYLTAAGGMLGILGALTIDRIVDTFIHGLPGVEVRTLAATPAILSGVVVLAAVVPMRRALRVNPTIALRAE
ncbi:MAG: ABC transporter permease [Acidobacteria bacterium]|nr:ABC transporter permease [Acidobacteriota bacterium]